MLDVFLALDQLFGLIYIRLVPLAVILYHILIIKRTGKESLPSFVLPSLNISLLENFTRPTLLSWAKKREEEDSAGNYKLGMKSYKALKNAESMDGLRGLKSVSDTKLSVGAAQARHLNSERIAFFFGTMLGAASVVVCYLFWMKIKS